MAQKRSIHVLNFGHFGIAYPCDGSIYKRRGVVEWNLFSYLPLNIVWEVISKLVVYPQERKFLVGNPQLSCYIGCYRMILIVLSAISVLSPWLGPVTFGFKNTGRWGQMGSLIGPMLKGDINPCYCLVASQHPVWILEAARSLVPKRDFTWCKGMQHIW